MDVYFFTETLGQAELFFPRADEAERGFG